VHIFVGTSVSRESTKGDSPSYITAAKILEDYNVYGEKIGERVVPSAFRPPGYAYFIFIVRKISVDEKAIWIAQFMLGVLTSVLIWFALKKIFLKNEALTKTSMLLIVALPFSAMYIQAVLTETLTTALLWCTIVPLLQGNRMRSYILSGLGFSALCLTKDTYLFLPIVLFSIMLWSTKSINERKRQLIGITLFIATSFLTIGTWTARNYENFNELIPISKGRLGFVLWASTWATDDQFLRPDQSTSDLPSGRNYPPSAFTDNSEKELILSVIDNTEGDEILLNIALKRIYSQPTIYLKNCLVRLPKVWIGTRSEQFELTSKYLSRASLGFYAFKATSYAINTAILIFSLYGMYRAFRVNCTKLLILSCPIIYSVLFNFPLLGLETRYTQPVYEMLVIFAAYAAFLLYKRLR
jgi:hypothetical protein